MSEFNQHDDIQNTRETPTEEFAHTPEAFTPEELAETPAEEAVEADDVVSGVDTVSDAGAHADYLAAHQDDGTNVEAVDAGEVEVLADGSHRVGSIITPGVFPAEDPEPTPESTAVLEAMENVKRVTL